MTRGLPGARGGKGGGSPPATNARSRDRPPLPWLLPRKIAVPDRVVGYLDRAGLVERIMPTRRRLTVLKAPGGFGKTTLLAECCRRLREDGVPIAWISLDEQDEPAVLDTYIAYACQSAAAETDAGPQPLSIPDPGQPESAAESRAALAAREIAELRRPFVVVFDELERLPSPAAAALIDFLLQRGPANLHLALACRALPAGLDVAGAVLEGSAAMLSSDDLRFSKSELAAFFDGKLPRSRLAELMSDTAGWPFAVRISRNEMEGGEPGNARAARELAENWVESRLLAGLAADDRAFLLEVGLFEWMDPALLDEALERSDSARRIDTMPALAGLLEPVRDGATDVWRLHPLIREHCATRLFREAPERFRRIHRRISDALARRGETVAAMRHAVDAQEPALAGDILERAGGVHLWLREGTVQFQAAERWLREDVAAARPRLALVRCLALVLAGRLDEARQGYRSLSASLAGLEADGSNAGLELAAENCVVRGMIFLHGSERLGSENVATYLADCNRLARSPRIDVLTCGYLEHGLSIASGMAARFGTAQEHAARARRCFGESAYMTMLADIVAGQGAMARGLPKEAAAHYHRARRVARKTYVRDPMSAAMCEVLLQELALECTGGAALTGVPASLAAGSAPFQPHAAACATVIELRLRDRGVDSALAATERYLARVRAARLPALVRFLTALRVSLLAAAGRTDDAEQAWTSAGLPGAAADSLDLAGQTWREMEALSCARLRLLIARGRFDAARALAGQLRASAEARELRRTLMRALALSVVLERRAGEAEPAVRHLEACLRLYADTPYAGPLVRERADCAQVVRAYLRSAPESPARERAQWLLTAMEMAREGRKPTLSQREREVLQRLEEQKDKQIAADLGLSAHGVRYHLRNLFTKLGAHNRAEAVRRAREMGLVPGDS